MKEIDRAKKRSGGDLVKKGDKLSGIVAGRGGIGARPVFPAGGGLPVAPVGLRLERAESAMPDSFRALEESLWPCDAPVGQKNEYCVGIDPTGLDPQIVQQYPDLFEYGYGCLRCQATLEDAVATGTQLSKLRAPLRAMLVTPGMTATNLHKFWSLHLKLHIADLFEEEWSKLPPDATGAPPPKPPFALCIVGSLSRDEASPYSDVDAFCLVGTDDRFQARLLEQVFDRMGKRWTYGDVSFTASRWAGQTDKHYGVRWCQGAGNGPALNPVNLCDTPARLLEKVEAQGAHVLDAKNADFLFGTDATADDTQRLVHQATPLFQTWQDLVRREAGGTEQRRCLEKLAGLVAPGENGKAGYFPEIREVRPGMWEVCVDSDNPEERDARGRPLKVRGRKGVSIKHDLYRGIQMAIRYFAWYHGAKELSIRGQLQELVDGGRMALDVVRVVFIALEEFGKLRIRHHLHEGREEDTLCMDGPADAAASHALRTMLQARDMLCLQIEHFVAKQGQSAAFMAIPVAWTSDAHGRCELCDVVLGRMFRHHCRKCGKLVCARCSQGRHILKLGQGMERVCDGCIREQGDRSFIALLR